MEQIRLRNYTQESREESTHSVRIWVAVVKVGMDAEIHMYFGIGATGFDALAITGWSRGRRRELR